MHRWRRLEPEGPGERLKAECVNCELVLEGEDALDVFSGAETPIGQLGAR
jgi:hypothetical protein